MRLQLRLRLRLRLRCQVEGGKVWRVDYYLPSGVCDPSRPGPDPVFFFVFLFLFLFLLFLIWVFEYLSIWVFEYLSIWVEGLTQGAWCRGQGVGQFVYRGHQAHGSLHWFVWPVKKLTFLPYLTFHIWFSYIFSMSITILSMIQVDLITNSGTASLNIWFSCQGPRVIQRWQGDL